MIIVCDQCGHGYRANQNIVQLPAPDKGADVTEYFIRCPRCETTTHTHYTNPAIERRQQLVQIAVEHHQKQHTETTWKRYKQAQAALQREFESLNPKKAAT